MRENVLAESCFVFDFDGVIFDSEPIQCEVMFNILKPYLREDFKAFEERFIRDFVGGETKANLTSLLSDSLSNEEIDELDAQLDSSYRKAVFDGVTQGRYLPRQGVRQLLRFLQENSIPAMIASGSERSLVMSMLKQFSLLDFFADVFSSVNQCRPKPAPDVYLQSAERLDYRPCQCFAIEDSSLGIQAATRAEMNAVATPNRYTQHQDFSAAGWIFSTVEDFLVFLLIAKIEFGAVVSNRKLRNSEDTKRFLNKSPELKQWVKQEIQRLDSFQ
jgi:HAD superfamily hydrolase (TIGR01509 family)